jgi:3-methyl-2-oxobutanoate hydroxymethyltransferase
MSVNKEVKRITTNTVQEMKVKGEKIGMLTAYDYSMAIIIDDAGADIILVGDSASNVMAGYETTLPITLDQMIYHASSVVRAAKRALIVVDLPFGSYQFKRGFKFGYPHYEGSRRTCGKNRRRRGNSRIG